MAAFIASVRPAILRQKSPIITILQSESPLVSKATWRTSSSPATTQSYRLLHGSDHILLRGDSRLFSSVSNSSGGFFSGIKDKFNERTERKKAEKMAEQFEKMANAEVWTIKDFSADITEGLSSWRAKIPGLANSAEMNKMKETGKLLEALTSLAGPEATFDDLSKMGRKEKLKVCIKGEASMEDVNALISQVEAMETMHSVLRYRKEVGKPLPTDQHSLKAAMQEDGMNAISKEQAERIKEKWAKKGRKLFR